MLSGLGDEVGLHSLYLRSTGYHTPFYGLFVLHCRQYNSFSVRVGLCRLPFLNNTLSLSVSSRNETTTLAVLAELLAFYCVLLSFYECFVFHLPNESMNKITMFCFSNRFMSVVMSYSLGNVTWPHDLLPKIIRHCEMTMGLNTVINTCKNCFVMIMWSLCCRVAPRGVYNSQSLQLKVTDWKCSSGPGIC